MFIAVLLASMLVLVWLLSLIHILLQVRKSNRPRHRVFEAEPIRSNKYKLSHTDGHEVHLRRSA